jgi:hypothetical protein
MQGSAGRRRGWEPRREPQVWGSRELQVRCGFRPRLSQRRVEESQTRLMAEERQWWRQCRYLYLPVTVRR